MKSKKKPSSTMQYISNMSRSPCSECVVESICTKSFVDNTACEEFLLFIEDLLKAARMLDEPKSQQHTKRY